MIMVLILFANLACFEQLTSPEFMLYLDTEIENLEVRSSTVRYSKLLLIFAHTLTGE